MIINTFFPQRTQNFVRINEKSNLKLSDRFCWDPIVNVNGTKNIVRISENSNYRVFELTGVDYISEDVQY